MKTYVLDGARQSKDRNLQASSFKRFGKTIGLNDTIINSVFDELPNWLSTTTDFVQKSLLKEESKARYLELVNERFKLLIV